MTGNIYLLRILIKPKKQTAVKQQNRLHVEGTVKAIQPKNTNSVNSRFGGPEETRTLYLYVANVALSQMSYRPK